MAHFARMIKGTNVVHDVVVISNNDIKDEAGNESEQKGIEFCKSLWKDEFDYLQCSYSGSIRGVYPSSGFMYDSENNVFVNPNETQGMAV